MNIWKDIRENRVTEERFIACVEISKGGKQKYELDKETGRLILDRVLYSATHYPANYGFIPLTYADDNDPLDVLILCQEELVPLCLVECYPIGVIKMIDSNEVDEKIIAIPFGDPSLACYKHIDELPQHVLLEMRHFFEVYKILEGKQTFVLDTGGPEEAKNIIRKSIFNYKEKIGKKVN